MNGKEACSPNLQLIIHEFVSGETCLKVKICCKNMIIHISIESIDVVFFCFVGAFAFGVFFCPSPSFGGSTVLSLTRGPAGNRTTTGSLSATARTPRYQLSHEDDCCVCIWSGVAAFDIGNHVDFFCSIW